tara:strand:- start:15119 stop:16036 length:918 start_codon:yes stop_codon:yes gene_type:complete
MNNKRVKVGVKSVSNLMSQMTTGYGKKKSGYYPPSLEGYDYNSKSDNYMKKCKPYQVRSEKGRCIGRKPKSGSRTGSNLAAKAMKLKHKEGISLKEAWKKVRFGYTPPDLVDVVWNPVSKSWLKKCGPGKVRNPDTNRCKSDGTARKGKTSGPKTLGPKAPKQIKGYKVEIVVNPRSAEDHWIDLTGKNRGHNLKKLVEYYSRPQLLPQLEGIYDIKNTQVTKRIVEGEGRIVFRYDHLNAENIEEVEVAADMALNLDEKRRFPIATNGAGRIMDINPPESYRGVHDLTFLSNALGAEKKWRPFY